MKTRQVRELKVPVFISMHQRRRYEKARQLALQKLRTETSTHGGKVRRHSDGLLEVSPEGEHAKQLAKENSTSPLLSLPGEIRKMIFEYAVGGNSFEVVGCNPYQWVPHNDDTVGWVTNKKKDCFSLLRVCRKIYDETVNLPFKSNLITFAEGWHRVHVFHKFFATRLPSEREAITSIQLIKRTHSSHPYYRHRPDEPLMSLSTIPKDVLPNLKTIYISVYFPVADLFDEDELETIKTRMEALNPGVEVVLAGTYWETRDDRHDDLPYF